MEGSDHEVQWRFFCFGFWWRKNRLKTEEMNEAQIPTDAALEREEKRKEKRVIRKR